MLPVTDITPARPVAVSYTHLDEYKRQNLGQFVSDEMHAVQTSCNCVRHLNSDNFAGLAPAELPDPRPS